MKTGDKIVHEDDVCILWNSDDLSLSVTDLARLTAALTCGQQKTEQQCWHCRHIQLTVVALSGPNYFLQHIIKFGLSKFDFKYKFIGRNSSDIDSEAMKH